MSASCTFKLPTLEMKKITFSVLDTQKQFQLQQSHPLSKSPNSGSHFEAFNKSDPQPLLCTFSYCLVLCHPSAYSSLGSIHVNLRGSHVISLESRPAVLFFSFQDPQGLSTFLQQRDLLQKCQETQRVQPPAEVSLRQPLSMHFACQ